jgi:hypothetical protein
MRTTITLSVLCLLASASASFASEGLFSRVSSSSVYGSTSTNPVLRSETPSALLGSASLSDTLKKAGLAPEKVSDEVISVKIERGGWSLPVLLTLSEDRGRIRMVMLLSTLKESQQLTVQKLTELLEANRTSANSTYFAYSTKRRRVELHRAIENRSITAGKLRGQLDTLGAFAEKSRVLWKIDTQSTTIDESPSSSSTEKSPSLVGKWAAARSKTVAFALQLKADSSFALVTVSGGKTNKSTGKYTLVDKRLTLVDSKGSQLAGAVKLVSASEFVFTPENSSTAKAGLRFKRAS